MRKDKLKQISDEDLVKMYVESQSNIYFEELYSRYSDKVFRKCYSFTYSQVQAEDFTHDIFLKLIVKIGTFKENSKFSTWLYSITYNFCMDQLRTTKKQAEVALDDNYDFYDEPEDTEFLNIKGANLKNSLQKIDSSEKALLLMKYQDDFSIKDISETLKISESAVKMRLLRSKEKLKKVYLENFALLSLIIIKLMLILKK